MKYGHCRRLYVSSGTIPLLLMPETASALILTLDAAAQAYFDSLRQRHFPRAINYLAAHLTLFHHLPGTGLAAVQTHLQAVAQARPPLPLRVTGLRSLGRGVAFTLENDELRALHRQLQADFAPHLTPQDQQELQPHITIQNKVDPAAARQLLADLQADFRPFEAVGTGLHLWAYRGGPWESVARFPFGG